MTYYHGTNADLAIGDTLIPGAQLDKSANHGRSNHVYLTWDGYGKAGNTERDYAVKEAFSWARTACMVAEEASDEEQQAYVYVVEPLSTIEPDDSGDDAVGEEAVRVGSARIVGIVDPYDLEAYLPDVFYGETYLNI